MSFSKLELGAYNEAYRAMVPRSLLGAVRAENEGAVFPLPELLTKAKRHLLWRTGHHSFSPRVLRSELQLKKK